MTKQELQMRENKAMIKGNAFVRDFVEADKKRLGLPKSVPLHLVPYIAFYSYTDGFHDAQIKDFMDNGNGGVQILETNVKDFIRALKECYRK